RHVNHGMQRITTGTRQLHVSLAALPGGGPALLRGKVSSRSVFPRCHTKSFIAGKEDLAIGRALLLLLPAAPSETPRLAAKCAHRPALSQPSSSAHFKGESFVIPRT